MSTPAQAPASIAQSTLAQVLNGGRVAELEPIEKAKRLAAFAAVDNHVKPEHKVSRGLLLIGGLRSMPLLNHLDSPRFCFPLVRLTIDYVIQLL